MTTEHMPNNIKMSYSGKTIISKKNPEKDKTLPCIPSR